MSLWMPRSRRGNNKIKVASKNKHNKTVKCVYGKEVYNQNSRIQFIQVQIKLFLLT